MIFDEGFKDLKHDEKIKKLLDHGEVDAEDLLQAYESLVAEEADKLKKKIKEHYVQKHECEAIGEGDERTPGMAKITTNEESYKT